MSFSFQFGLYCSQFYKVALSQSLYFIGMLLGAWFLGPLADKMGRRKVYLYSLIAFVITTFISAAGFSYVLFAFSRFVLGFASAGVAITYFVLLMEIIGPDYRAMMGIASMGFFSLGIMILPVFTYLIPNWKLLTGLLGVLGVVHLTMFRLVNYTVLFMYNRLTSMEMISNAAFLSARPISTMLTALSEIFVGNKWLKHPIIALENLTYSLNNFSIWEYSISVFIVLTISLCSLCLSGFTPSSAMLPHLYIKVIRVCEALHN